MQPCLDMMAHVTKSKFDLPTTLSVAICSSLNCITTHALPQFQLHVRIKNLNCCRLLAVSHAFATPPARNQSTPVTLDEGLPVLPPQPNRSRFDSAGLPAYRHKWILHLHMSLPQMLQLQLKPRLSHPVVQTVHERCEAGSMPSKAPREGYVHTRSDSSTMKSPTAVQAWPLCTAGIQTIADSLARTTRCLDMENLGRAMDLLLSHEQWAQWAIADSILCDLAQPSAQEASSTSPKG